MQRYSQTEPDPETFFATEKMSLKTPIDNNLGSKGIHCIRLEMKIITGVSCWVSFVLLRHNDEFLRPFQYNFYVMDLKFETESKKRFRNGE